MSSLFGFPAGLSGGSKETSYNTSFLTDKTTNYNTSFPTSHSTLYGTNHTTNVTTNWNTSYNTTYSTSRSTSEDVYAWYPHTGSHTWNAGNSWSTPTSTVGACWAAMSWRMSWGYNHENLTSTTNLSWAGSFTMTAVDSGLHQRIVLRTYWGQAQQSPSNPCAFDKDDGWANYDQIRSKMNNRYIANYTDGGSVNFNTSPRTYTYWIKTFDRPMTVRFPDFNDCFKMSQDYWDSSTGSSQTMVYLRIPVEVQYLQATNTWNTSWNTDYTTSHITNKLTAQNTAYNTAYTTNYNTSQGTYHTTQDTTSRTTSHITYG